MNYKKYNNDENVLIPKYRQEIKNTGKKII